MIIATTAPITWTRTYSDGIVRFSFRTQVGDVAIAIIAEENWRRPASKTRVYIDGEEPATESLELAERLSREAGSLMRGVSLEADKAWDKHNRQVVKNKKARLAELIETIPLAHDLLAGVKLNFSRKAGCSCGCSAGFIADRAVLTMDTVPSWRPGEVEQCLLRIKQISFWTVKA